MKVPSHVIRPRIVIPAFCLLFLFSLSAPSTVQAQAACISITTLGSAYNQSFNALSNVAGSTTNDLTMTGWGLTESGGGARDNEQYAVDTGGSNTGDTYSYGTAGSAERALGGLRSGTLIPVFGACFTNNTGSMISNLDVAYTGEEWRLGTTTRTDQINFEYSTNATSLVTGVWTSVSALNFITPDTITMGAKNGNAAGCRTALSSTISSLSIANGSTFWIRWIDLDAGGADDGLAVDDFSLTPQASLPTLNISDVTLIEGNSGSTTFTFAVTLTAPAGAGGVTFDIATADGSAQDNIPAAEDNDYVAQSLTGQTIPIGSTGPYNFSVTMYGDTNIEPDETFFVNVTNITGANAGDTQGQGTINRDDLPEATVTLGNLNQMYDGTPKSVTVTTDPAGLSVTITYDGSSMLPTDAGSYAVVATVNDPNYEGSASGTLQIDQASLTVTANNTNKMYGTPLPAFTVSYSGFVPGQDPSHLDGALTFNTTATQTSPVGTYDVAPIGLTSTNYDIAFVKGTLTITYADATVTLGNLNQMYDGTPKSATATTDPAGLSASFTYNGSSTPPTNVGIYTVVATVNDPNYQGSASGTLDITAANTATTITSDAPDPSQVGQMVIFTYTVGVVAPGGGTPAGNVTVDNGTDSCTGTVEDGFCSIIFTALGTSNFVAIYNGDSNFSGSTSAFVEHTVNEAPSITSADNFAFTAGSFTVTTSGYPVPTITRTGVLPAGVSFADNGDGTATLSGTPTAGTGGTYNLTFTASNGVLPDATQNFTLTASEAPAIASPDHVTFVAGNPGMFTVTTTGYPIPGIDYIGTLPSGITFIDNDDGTGTLAGTPALSSTGTHNLIFAARNGIVPDATQNFTLTVEGPPAVDHINSLAATVDGEIVENEHTNAAITQLLVVFNKAMNAGDVENESNYRLALDSSPDIVINNITYDSASHTATLNINGGLALANGKYILTVSGMLEDTLGAPIGDPFQRIFYVDNAAPHHTVVLSLPNNTTITNGATVDVSFSSIAITFDEDVNNPTDLPDPTEPNDVTNPQNYLLLSPGPNGTFDTPYCALGLTGDDVQIPTGPVTYNNNGGTAPFVATVQLNGGTALQNGAYRLFICGTTSIVDLAGNRLNGGLDEQLNFNILALDGVETNPHTGFAPNVVTILPEQPAEKAYRNLGDLWIEIPALKLQTDITGVPLEAQGWDVTWLHQQVGWLEGTAYPTWDGNTLLTAHGYTADGNAGPFAFLKDLKYGETITIHLGDMKYSYVVRANFGVTPNNTYWLTRHEELDWITLITCEQYDEKTTSYRYRRVVRAVLISVEQE